MIEVSLDMPQKNNELIFMLANGTNGMEQL